MRKELKIVLIVLALVAVGAILYLIMETNYLGTWVVGRHDSSLHNPGDAYYNEE